MKKECENCEELKKRDEYIEDLEEECENLSAQINEIIYGAAECKAMTLGESEK